METIINAGFKSNNTRLWSNYGFFKSISCDFHVGKSNVPEMTILYINQAYFKDKYGKKIYCCDLFVTGQATPTLNPEDLENYVPEEDEIKTLRPKYNVVCGQFLGLVETLAYLTVRGDKCECFFGYEHDKDNSKVFYSTHKMKILNKFNAIIFDRHKYEYEYEAGAFLDTDFYKTFFFLPFVIDRSEDIVDLLPIDIELSDFGEDFDPSRLDFENANRERNRKSLLTVLRKMVYLCNDNLQKKVDCLLANKTSQE